LIGKLSFLKKGFSGGMREARLMVENKAFPGIKGREARDNYKNNWLAGTSKTARDSL